MRHPPAFDQTHAALAYGFPLDALVRRCKYQGVIEITDLFARLLSETCVSTLKAPPTIDLIIPMPLHPVRLADRGFNQSVEITRRLAPRLNLRWQAMACTREINTPPQAGLNLKARQRNLRGAFACNTSLDGLRVALVDDVMTTGTSLNELARVVKAAGAAWVENWVVARTL